MNTPLEIYFPESKNILSVSYNPELKVLCIKFKPTGIYNYFDIPAEKWEEFSKTKSAGTFFAKEIKNKFRFQQLK